MAASTRDSLEAVHVQLTEFWATRLREAKDDPEKPLTAAEATALAKFLKDNNVTAILSNSPAGRNVLIDVPFEVEDHSAE